MTPQEIRLEVLRLLKLPDIASPDLKLYLDRAKALEAYVIGEGQAKAPPHQTAQQPQTQARTTLPSQHPAHRK